eukprot:1145143-Pelagomonas_calceolata.AAC.1
MNDTQQGVASLSGGGGARMMMIGCDVRRVTSAGYKACGCAVSKGTAKKCAGGCRLVSGKQPCMCCDAQEGAELCVWLGSVLEGCSRA